VIQREAFVMQRETFVMQRDEQRQAKSHESLIVWTRFEQRQTFVRFCSTMFHEDGA
jgi:hypothetical protein